VSHDLGLGGPYEVERDPEALHSGPCFDGVYGCHRCWDAANDGKGTVADCEGRCGAKNVPTRIIQASDEPVLYAACEACRERATAHALEELYEFDNPFYVRDSDADEDDDDGRRL
jgi:hypothetical protein